MVGVDLLTLAQVLTAYRGGESKVEEKVEAKINFDITTVNTPAEIKVKVSELL
ncbi:MAG: hypothetical protein H6767_06630 [Candidatus Peribacteria bacterium]|nr:MAG: hypothetical protein H6767_06630 [Candidatus Peribacteria bacterium]